MASNPVPSKPTVSYPSPELDDRILVEYHDHKQSKKGPEQKFREVPEYGTEHPDRKYQDFRLVFVEPAPDLGDQWYRWVWANDRTGQDAYNYEVEYPYGDKDYPRYTRGYVYRRGQVPNIDYGDPDPVVADLVLVDLKEARIEDKTLDSLFVYVLRVYEKVPGPVITSPILTKAGVIGTLTTQQPVLMADAESLVDVEGDLSESRVTPINAYIGKFEKVSGETWENSAGIEVSDSSWGAPVQVSEQLLDVGDTFLPQAGLGLVSFQVEAASASQVKVTEKWTEWPQLSNVTRGELSLIPAKFRASLSLSETISKVAPGTAPDSLSSTVLESTVKGETEYRSEKRTLSLSSGTFPTLTGKRMVDGRLMDVTQTVVNAGTTPDTGLLIWNTETDPINSSLSVQTSFTVGSYADRVNYRRVQGALEKETRSIVAAGTVPTSIPARATAVSIRALSDYHAEKVVTELVSTTGAALSAFPVVPRYYRDERTGVLITEYRQLVASTTVLEEEIGDEYPENTSNEFVIGAELRPIEDSDKLLKIITVSPIPEDRVEYPVEYYEFPGILSDVAAWSSSSATVQPPYAGVHYNYKAPRKLRKAAKAFYTYSLEPNGDALPDVYRVNSPGAGSKVFGRIISANTIHPGYTLIVDGVTVEILEESTPNTYDPEEPIIIYTDEKPWKGNIYERVIVKMVEEGDPHDIT